MFCVVGVQVEVVTQYFLPLLNVLCSESTGRGSHSNNYCPYLMFCVVGVQVEVVTHIILALTKCSVWWEYR